MYVGDESVSTTDCLGLSDIHDPKIVRVVLVPVTSQKYCVLALVAHGSNLTTYFAWLSPLERTDETTGCRISNQSYCVEVMLIVVDAVESDGGTIRVHDNQTVQFAVQFFAIADPQYFRPHSHMMFLIHRTTGVSFRELATRFIEHLVRHIVSVVTGVHKGYS